MGGVDATASICCMATAVHRQGGAGCGRLQLQGSQQNQKQLVEVLLLLRVLLLVVLVVEGAVAVILLPPVHACIVLTGMHIRGIRSLAYMHACRCSGNKLLQTIPASPSP